MQLQLNRSSNLLPNYNKIVVLRKCINEILNTNETLFY